MICDGEDGKVLVPHNIYCIFLGRIKGFTSAITAIMCQVVVIELWYVSYRMLKVVIEHKE